MTGRPRPGALTGGLILSHVYIGFPKRGLSTHRDRAMEKLDRYYSEREAFYIRRDGAVEALEELRLSEKQLQQEIDSGSMDFTFHHHERWGKWGNVFANQGVLDAHSTGRYAHQLTEALDASMIGHARPWTRTTPARCCSATKNLRNGETLLLRFREQSHPLKK